MDVQTALELYFYWAMGASLLLLFFLKVSGKWMIAYGSAYLSFLTKGSGKVIIEYTHTKEYSPFHAKIPKDLPSAAEFPGGKRGVIGLRRGAWGVSSGTQTAICPSEVGYIVSPADIAGERFFKVKDEETLLYAYPDPVNEGKLVKISKEEYYDKKKYPAAGIWVQYPTAIASPDEFVKFQKLSQDPLLREHYGEHKANEVRAQMNNPINAMLAQHGWLIIAIILVGAIAYNWTNQQNIAGNAMGELNSCKQTMINLYEAGICKGNAPAAIVGNIPAPVVNVTQYPGGGGIS